MADDKRVAVSVDTFDWHWNMTGWGSIIDTHGKDQRPKVGNPNYRTILARALQALSDPYCHCQKTCLWDVSATLMQNNSENISDLGGSCPINSLRESVYGASTCDVIDNVTWLYDVILLMSQYSWSSHSETNTAINYSRGSFKHIL